MYKLSNLIFILLLAAGLAETSACNKAMDEPLRSLSNGVRDTTSDVRAVLAASPCHLFSQAFSRLQLDSSYGIYTIFAPTDSVMQAAGLTTSVIAALSTDSLYKIVAYHTVYGAYSDSMLANSPSTLQVPTVRVDVFYGPAANSNNLVAQTVQQSLYVWKAGSPAEPQGVLYVNGKAANNGEPPLKARNGWIYPVNHLFTAATNNLWKVLLSKPELSFYTAAIRMVDSFYKASFFAPPFASLGYDTVNFSLVAYGNMVTQPAGITVFAPTNTAFANAGFNTLNDLRNLVLRTRPSQFYQTSYQPYGYVYTYSGMDSVLKEHYLYSPGGNAQMYQDLLNPAINTSPTESNTNPWTVQNFISDPKIAPFYTQFSNNGGTVNIRYSRDPSVPPAVLPPDGVSFLAINGFIYETDQLFYPHN